jgi:hypothetical protein
MDIWYILLSFGIFFPLLVKCGNKDLATLATRARNVFARKTEKGGEVRVFFAFLVPKKIRDNLDARVARWHVFKSKNTNLGKFPMFLQWKTLVHFMPVRPILRPFGIYNLDARVARWHSFKPKNTNLGKFGCSCNVKRWSILRPFGIFLVHLVYFAVIWYILRPFGTFNCHLVYYWPIWYIFTRTKKNLATLLDARNPASLAPKSCFGISR